MFADQKSQTFIHISQEARNEVMANIFMKYISALGQEINNVNSDHM